MKTWIKVLIVTLVFAIPAFLVAPNAPLGVFWDPHPDITVPDITVPMGIQGSLFTLLSAINALVLGLGIAFLLFGYPLVMAIGCASRGLTRAAHLSIGWLLVSPWLHDSLHMVVGLETGPLLAVEYGIHATAMIAGLIVAYFFVDALRGREAAPATAAC